MNKIYSQHPAMFRNNPIVFIIFLILILVFGVGLLLFIIWHVKNKSSKLVVTERSAV